VSCEGMITLHCTLHLRELELDLRDAASFYLSSILLISTFTLFSLLYRIVDRRQEWGDRRSLHALNWTHVRQNSQLMSVVRRL
jgi:hypothetical protein